MTLKQVIVVRADLKMSKGKLAAQACHASVSAVLKSDRKKITLWEREGQKKIILKAKTLEELLNLKKKCDHLRLTACIISDAGHTELTPGTITALGIGPDNDTNVDKVTGSLPLMK